ncbi:MAG TPA: hypothetical protein VMS55_15240 [Myxococcota bacterium]|nr:hypothetical protein [Myxococcota bacterium]
MEEKDRNLEPEEDRTLDRTLREGDEGDDVEAHAGLKGRGLPAIDEGDDDVEAHRALN